VSEPLEVVATISVRPGRADAVVAIVSEHLSAVRAEEGCVRYDLFRVRREPDTLVMVETWASREALRTHGTAEHFVRMSEQLAPELDGPPAVRVLEPVPGVAT
jgi:quinol monooxygenase YgiN